jgi:hypothetical protein
MALISNTNAQLVTVDDVEAVYANNMTSVVSGEYFRDGGYYWEGYNVYGGCGNANGDAGVVIVLKDNIQWNRAMCLYEMTGTASCWSFWGNSGGGGYGVSGPNVPPEINSLYPGGNMKSYAGMGLTVNSDPQGVHYWQTNCFSSNSNFTYKWSACDNNNQNFMHGGYATGGGGYKAVWIKADRAINRLNGITWTTTGTGTDGAYNGKDHASYSGKGAYANFNVTVSGGVVTAVTRNGTVRGWDYQVGDQFTIPSSQLTGSCEVTVTVASLYNELSGVATGRSCAQTNKLTRVSGIYRWYEPE